MNFEAWLAGLKFDPRGLVPVVVHDPATGRVLTLAWADREALERTRSTGLAHFHSRSRDALWMKGETSGHVQRVLRVARDCDADAVLYEVSPSGPACHTGLDTCFFEEADLPARAGANAPPARAAHPVPPPPAAPAASGAPAGAAAPGSAAGDSGVAFLAELFELIQARKARLPEGSYTTKLFREGRPKIAQKVGEEAVEVCVAALVQTPDRVADESADLLYHLLVLWADVGLSPGDVVARLRDRHAGRKQ